MLTRLKEIKHHTDRLGVGRAFRYSRETAGGVTGSFFALGSFGQVPLNEYLFGYGPAATTLTIACTVFVTSMMNNHSASIPNSPQMLVEAKERLSSIEMIVDKLRSDRVKMTDFLNKHKIKSDDISRLEKWANDNGDDVQAILDALYNHINLNIEKYPISLGIAMMQMAAHFMECMLIRVFVDLHYFDYGNEITMANFMLTFIMLVALYNGVCTFLEVKHSYEHPSSAKLCTTIFAAYDRHTVKETVNVAAEDKKQSEASNGDSPQGNNAQVCLAV